VNELGLLRLAQAQAAANQWDQSRNSYEQFVGRFAPSPWVEEARFGAAWSAQNQNQHDHAVNVYTQVRNNTKAEVAARAQLQMGLCRLAQQRWQEAHDLLMVVPYTYDYPQWMAPALVGAAKALVQLKKPAEARAALERVVKEHAGTPHAEEATKLLAEIKI
jgi:TolA-binding protein